MTISSGLEQYGRVLSWVVLVPNWSRSKLQDLSSFLGRDGFELGQLSGTRLRQLYRLQLLLIWSSGRVLELASMSAEPEK